jgi:hypothetical protein
MNPNTSFERDLAHWLQAEAPTAAPVGLHDAVIHRARSRRQRPGWATSVPARWLGRNRGLTLLSAASLLLLGSALAAGSGLVPDVVDRLRIDDPPLPTTPDAWSRSRSDGPSLDEHAMTAGGPGLVAVGARDAMHQQADIWTSSDGRTWSRVPEQELGLGLITEVTTGGPGLVAVGHSDSLQKVWTSRDGITWSRAHDPLLSVGSIGAVTAGGPGLVAVGSPDRALFSSDGLTWELASVPPVPPGVSGGGADLQVSMSDVAAAGDRLVAIGSAFKTDDAESREAVMWISADGRTWTDVPLDAEVFPRGSRISSVTGGPDGFIAIMDDESGPDPVRFSPDGRRWLRVGTEGDPFRSSQPGPGAGSVSVRSVTAGSSGFVAVGRDEMCNDVGECVGEAAVWISQDGRSWVRVPTGPVFRPSAPADPEQWTGAEYVFPWGSGFLAIGSYEGDGAVWMSEAPSK